jgi:hypothetical protein
MPGGGHLGHSRRPGRRGRLVDSAACRSPSSRTCCAARTSTRLDPRPDGVFRWMVEEVGEVAKAMRRIPATRRARARVRRRAGLAHVSGQPDGGRPRPGSRPLRGTGARGAPRSLLLRVPAHDVRVPASPEEDRDRGARRPCSRRSARRRTWRERTGPHVRLDLYLCAYDGDRLIATRLFASSSRSSSGERAAVLRRGGRRGDARHARARARRSASSPSSSGSAGTAGDLVSMLYPATVAVYRKLGYELGGRSYVEQHRPCGRCPAPAARGSSSRPSATTRGLDDLRACFRAWAPAHNGPVWFSDQSSGGRPASSGCSSPTPCRTSRWRTGPTASRATRATSAARGRASVSTRRARTSSRGPGARRRRSSRTSAGSTASAIT